MYDHRYGDAIALSEQTPSVRQNESLWLQYLVALASAGRRADGLREVTAFVQRFPDRCAARALLAGLTLDRGANAARQLAAPILAEARKDDARASVLACATAAAAGLGDGVQVAALLQRIISNESLMRGWILSGIAQSDGRLALRGDAYPWSNVVEQPPVVAVKQRLDAAFAREREIARAVLSGLP